MILPKTFVNNDFCRVTSFNYGVLRNHYGSNKYYLSDRGATYLSIKDFVIRLSKFRRSLYHKI